MSYEPPINNRDLLEWHIAAGVDEAVGDEAVNYFNAPTILRRAEGESAGSPPAAPDPVQPLRVSQDSSPLHHSPSAAAATSRALADQAMTLAEVEEAVRNFDGCQIKKTASKTVFCDGNPRGGVMIIGEAPGAQEDIQGIPFCGPSGKLLDAMLAAIGLNRAESVYISNTVFWRPPGNRQPSPEETAICLPLVEKHIALANPRLLILAGGTAATSVLRKETSISRLRGKFYEYTNIYMQAPIPAVVTFHPSYLLRSPQQKALAWDDLLMIQGFLKH